MIPYNWKEPQVLWWMAWQDHIKNAKQYPDRAQGYCQAAVIAQAEYVMALAIRMVKEYYS